MKIKLTKTEALYFCSAIADEVNISLFENFFEYQITSLTLKRFIRRLAKREYPKDGKQSTIKLEEFEVVALNKILPHIWSNDPYVNAIINTIMSKVHKECLMLDI